MSGSVLANQDKRLFNRLLMLLMLNVATFTKFLFVAVPLGCPFQKAGTILPAEGNGKPRTKTHNLVLQVAALSDARKPRRRMTVRPNDRASTPPAGLIHQD
jgi:hypothetical protein